jgi:TIR domain
MKPIRIFFSYAHEDEKFRKELEKHLSFLKRSKKIIGWHDRRISPGANWEQEINDNIDQAQVILMLISPDFINSDYCYETESIRALEKHNKGEALVIPIIIRPCLWRETPFQSLQALPTDGVPVSTSSNPDEAWLNVAQGLLEVVNERIKKNEDTEADVDEVKTVVSEKTKNREHEDQILKFLAAYKKYWFSPIKIKSMADKVPGTKDLTSLEVSSIIEYCEALSKKGLLNTMLNAKGNKIYKIN